MSRRAAWQPPHPAAAAPSSPVPTTNRHRDDPHQHQSDHHLPPREPTQPFTNGLSLPRVLGPIARFAYMNVLRRTLRRLLRGAEPPITDGDKQRNEASAAEQKHAQMESEYLRSLVEERNGGLGAAFQLFRLLLLGVAAIAYLISGQSGGASPYVDLRVFMPVVGALGALLLPWTAWQTSNLLRLTRLVDERFASFNPEFVGSGAVKLYGRLADFTVWVGTKKSGERSLWGLFLLTGLLCVYGVGYVSMDAYNAVCEQQKACVNEPDKTLIFPWEVILAAVQNDSNIASYLTAVMIVSCLAFAGLMLSYAPTLREIRERAQFIRNIRDEKHRFPD